MTARQSITIPRALLATVLIATLGCAHRLEATIVAADWLAPRASVAANWPVFGGDPGRSGNAGDRLLTTTNVVGLKLRWRINLGDVADSAPIAVGNHLFLTSKNGTTYALNASDGRIVWRFNTHGPNITTSVPAYDSSTKALYVPGVDGFIRKLDPATGHELRGPGFPAQITPAPETEKNASALNIANGYLYAQTSGYFGDAAPYVGHVVAIRLSDGIKNVFNSLCSSQHRLINPQSCSQQRSGMWSRSGVVVDPDPSMGGRIYVATGNGAFNASEGDYGDSVLSLSFDAGHLLSYYAPNNYSELEASDLDLGSSSPALLPREAGSATPLMAVQGGKDAILRLLNRIHLGGIGNALQNVNLSDKLFSAPAVWSDHGMTLVIIDLSDGVYAYKMVTENGRSRLAKAWQTDVASTYEGTSPIVSSGIVFVAGSSALVALDAKDGHRLWSHIVGRIHWESPIVANGTLYCSDEDGNVTAFGLTSGAK
jgi:outer membrane protein assembly factor BamB